MLSTFVDLIFGSKVQGMKTEITVAVTAGLNFLNALMVALGQPSISPDNMSMLNTVLLGLMAMFLGSRVKRVEKAATIAATSPATVIVNSKPVEPKSPPIPKWDEHDV